MAKCKYHESYLDNRTRYTKYGDTYTEVVMCGRCTGAKNTPVCYCHGDETKCDYYPDTKERAIKAKEEFINRDWDSRRLRPEAVAPFVLGGNATVTVQSGKTGKHFTYRIKRHKDDKDLYFVRLLVEGSDTYRYIACYYSDRKYLHLAEPWRDAAYLSWPASVRAIKFLFEKLESPPEQLLVYHEGRCARCGRPLTTPESIKRGFGPECYKMEEYNK